MGKLMDEIEEAFKAASSGLETKVDEALIRAGYTIEERDDGKYLVGEEFPDGRKLANFYDWAAQAIYVYIIGTRDPLSDNGIVSYGGVIGGDIK